MLHTYKAVVRLVGMTNVMGTHGASMLQANMARNRSVNLSSDMVSMLRADTARIWLVNLTERKMAGC